MKKGSRIRSAILMAAISLVLLPVRSTADMIVLRDGQSIEAENAYEQEGNIFFYIHGLKMRVSKKAVLRVTGNDKAAPVSPLRIKGNTMKDRNWSSRPARSEKAIEIETLPVVNPSGKQTKQIQSEIRWSGFRDLRWAIGRSTFGRLIEIESGTGQNGIKEYVRADEDLIMGKARLDSIVYAFWHDKLYAVSIWTTGYNHYRAMRNEVFNRFGIGHKGDRNRERYIWSDPYSVRMLKYDSAAKSGLFWMGSKELNRRHQLSRTKTPSTGLESTAARTLGAN
jgi:hypothetical protein